MTAALAVDPTNVGNAPGYGPLRSGGVSVSQLPAEGPRSQQNLPSTQSACVEKQMPALGICRDLWGGTELVRKKSTVYLPRNPAEGLTSYNFRLARAVVVNFFRNTIEGLSGFVFRKDPVLGDDVPAAIRTWWENVDNEGTHGDVFLRNMLVDAMTAGHAAILVEYPNTEQVNAPRTASGVLRLDVEQALGIRPYWVPIKKDNIVSFRLIQENGVRVLGQMVLKEVTQVPDGAYGEKERTIYRVLWYNPATRQSGWRTEYVTDQKTVQKIDDGIFKNQPTIPISEIPTAGRIDQWESQPTLLDLAYLNLAHYQQLSDYTTGIHKTNVPILTVSGVRLTKGESLEVGPDAALVLPDPAAKAYFTAHDGAALNSTKAALDDLKLDMAMLGLAALASQKRAAETATAKQLDKSASDSALSVTARGLQDAAERCLQFTANYMGLPSGGSIQINRDFEAMKMTAQEVMAWASLADKLDVPLLTVLEALKLGGWIPLDVDLEEIVSDSEAIKASRADEAMSMLAAKTAGAQQGTDKPVPADA